MDCNDRANSLVSFLRHGKNRQKHVLFVLNFTPVPRFNYRVGVPAGGEWREVLNSDAPLYGGGGLGNLGKIDASVVPMHGRAYSLDITVPPMAVVVFQKD
jgi:1,4-alpha-glucan branching enzyme